MAINFITGSDKKFREVKALLPDVIQLRMDLPEIQEIDAQKIVEAKLQVALTYHDEELIVEDTSLYLECLGGLPGPLVKWFEKTMATEGIAKMAIALGDTRAVARTIIGYVDSERAIHFFEGQVEGTIVMPRIPDAFGWDPIFMPNGYDRTFSEMTEEEKSAISMRGIAARKLLQHLDERNGTQ